MQHQQNIEQQQLKYFFLLSTKKNLVLYKQRRLVIKSTCTGFKTKTLKYDTSFMFFFFLFLELMKHPLT